MVTLEERISTATDTIEADTDLFHDIVHGAHDDPDIVTEGGSVKPVAKAVKEISDAALSLSGTSVSSVAIAIGSKAFTTQANKSFEVGVHLLIVDQANSDNFMHGQVAAYSGTDLTVDVTTIGGTGTINAWNIYVSGPRGDIVSLFNATEAARDLAEQWANEDEDVEVSGGEFSAKHYSIKASDSADAAATSETNAANSANAAAASAASVDINFPVSSVDNTVPRFNGTDGNDIQTSGVSIDDSDNLTVPGTVNGVTMSEVLVDGDLGTVVQAYDEDTAKTDTPQGWDSNQYLVPQTLSSSSGTLTINFNNGNYVEVTLTEDITTIETNNMNAGGTYKIRFKQAAGSSYTITGWDVSIIWILGNTTPVMNEVNDAYSMITIEAGTTEHLGSYQDFG